MPTHAELFATYLDAVAARKIDHTFTFYADDIVITQPFAKPVPTRFEGLATLKTHFDNATELPLELKRTHTWITESPLTPDGESTVVAEFDYDATNTATGKQISFSNVIIARMRDGKIVESHDYHDHSAFAALLTP